MKNLDSKSTKLVTVLLKTPSDKYLLSESDIFSQFVDTILADGTVFLNEMRECDAFELVRQIKSEYEVIIIEIRS